MKKHILSAIALSGFATGAMANNSTYISPSDYKPEGVVITEKRKEQIKKDYSSTLLGAGAICLVLSAFSFLDGRRGKSL